MFARTHFLLAAGRGAARRRLAGLIADHGLQRADLEGRAFLAAGHDGNGAQRHFVAPQRSSGLGPRVRHSVGLRSTQEPPGDRIAEPSPPPLTLAALASPWARPCLCAAQADPPDRALPARRAAGHRGARAGRQGQGQPRPGGGGKPPRRRRQPRRRPGGQGRARRHDDRAWARWPRMPSTPGCTRRSPTTRSATSRRSRWWRRCRTCW